MGRVGVGQGIPPGAGALGLWGDHFFLIRFPPRGAGLGAPLWDFGAKPGQRGFSQKGLFSS